MVELTLPESASISVDLAPDDRQDKSIFDRVPPERLAGRLTLGQPSAIRLTAQDAGDDRELRTFIQEQSAAYRFYLVHLSCTFDPPDDEPFTEAWVTVTFSQTGQSGEGPIAWSMDPEQLNRKMTLTRKVTLGAELKLGVGGADTQTEEGTEEEIKQPYLQAYNLRRPNPYWQFRERGSVHIDGAHLLKIVARCPRSGDVYGTVTAEALVRRKHLHIIPYRAQFEQQPQLEFKVS